MNNNIDVIKEQEALIQQLKEEIELKNKWLSLIAHDFKGSFSNILWVLDAYENEVIALDEFLSMLPEIKQGVQINQNTINDTFEWVNAELIGSKPQVMEVNVYELVTEVITSLEKTIKDKDISFIYSGDNGLTLSCNRIIFRFIIKKIIDNAIKYSYVGGEIEVEIMFKSSYLHVLVKDKGMGIDPQRLPSVFTLDGTIFTGTQNEKGAGLSLVIIKHFVKMLDGEVEIYSNNDNNGTIIELRFRTL